MSECEHKWIPCPQAGLVRDELKGTVHKVEQCVKCQSTKTVPA